MRKEFWIWIDVAECLELITAASDVDCKTLEERFSKIVFETATKGCLLNRENIFSFVSARPLWVKSISATYHVI